MAITANQVESSNTLEQFRQEFNKLQADVTGLEVGTIVITALTSTSLSTNIINLLEDGTIVFEGATNDAYQTTLTVVDPTAARTITLPDSSGDVVLSNSGDITISGTITGSTSLISSSIIASTAFLPDAQDGAALGTTSLQFSDLFLADGAVIGLGDDNDTTLTHVADTGILLNSSRKLQFGDSASYIHQVQDGHLSVVSDNTIIVSSANTEISGSTSVKLDAPIVDLEDDGVVLAFGADSDVTLTHVHDTGLLLNSDNMIQFNAAANNINGYSSTILVINGPTIDMNATSRINLDTPEINISDDGATLKFGGSQEIQLNHVHNVGLTLTHTATGDELPIVFQLKSEENEIVADEVIASLEFAAGDSSGTDAATVAAGIHAIAEGTFTSSANPTKLVFTTGVSETAAASATAKMTLSSGGNLNVAGVITQDDVQVKVAGKETIWIPAGAMYPSTTNPCSDLTQVETTALRPDLKVLDFATGADEFAQFSIAFPKSWNEGTVTFQPFWTVTGTNTGTVAWQLGGIAMSSDDTINTAFGTLVATTALAHSGTSNDLMVSVESGAVTIAGSPAAGDCCFFQINRDVSADNQSGDARLVGIKLHFTTDAGNDS